MLDPAKFLERWHDLGLFAVICAEEAGVPLPVPGDVFIAAAGFLSRGAPREFPWVAAVVTAATVIGASVLFTLSGRLGRPLLLRIGSRFGYTEARNARIEAWLSRRGATAVVVGRLIPGLRIVMTVVAGALHLRRGVFTMGTLLAGLIWATLYFWIGYALGAGYERVARGIPAKDVWPVAGLALVVVLFVILHRLRGRRLARAARSGGGPPPPPSARG